MSQCPWCGAETLKVVSVIQEAGVIEKFLAYLMLAARAPPLTAARDTGSWADW